MAVKKKKTTKTKKNVLNYREELKNSELLLKLKKSKEKPVKKEKRKKISRSTKLVKKSVKKQNKAVKTTIKKEVKLKKKENNITEEKYQEIQYYNEFDEELSSKSKIYDLFTLIIKTNQLTGNKRYYCTINCIYKNKKQEFNKELTTVHEVIMFFGNCNAVKKLYKKAKISTKITI